MSEFRKWPALGVTLLLAGCGQTGKLYLPEQSGAVVTRPTQTPPPESPAAEVTEAEREAERKKNEARTPDPARKD